MHDGILIVIASINVLTGIALERIVNVHNGPGTEVAIVRVADVCLRIVSGVIDVGASGIENGKGWRDVKPNLIRQLDQNSLLRDAAVLKQRRRRQLQHRSALVGKVRKQQFQRRGVLPNDAVNVHLVGVERCAGGAGNVPVDFELVQGLIRTRTQLGRRPCLFRGSTPWSCCQEKILALFHAIDAHQTRSTDRSLPGSPRIFTHGNKPVALYPEVVSVIRIDTELAEVVIRKIPREHHVPRRNEGQTILCRSIHSHFRAYGVVLGRSNVRPSVHRTEVHLVPTVFCVWLGLNCQHHWFSQGDQFGSVLGQFRCAVLQIQHNIRADGPRDIADGTVVPKMRGDLFETMCMEFEPNVCVKIFPNGRQAMTIHRPMRHRVVRCSQRPSRSLVCL